MRRLARSVALAALGLSASAASGQVEERDPTIANLPRPGYEPRTIILGAAVIRPTFDADVTYDDNILATPTRAEDDAIFSLRPRIKAELKDRSFVIQADAHAGVIRYAAHAREDVETFGALVDITKMLPGRQTLTANVSFDRTFERRSDPEADFDRALPPALINVATAGLDYRYQGSRFGAMVDATVTKLDYLPLADADRDLVTYHASVRGSYSVGRGVSAFVEPFVNRRDLRLNVSRTGVFGDTTTTGVLAGVSFDLAARLQGDLGGGFFSADPTGPGNTFNGVAASGRLVWHPRTRTALVLDAFRGDAVTIRTGALGRIDTRIGLAIDQEARHNLLLHAAAGIRNIHYIGGIDSDQRFHTGAVEARYLLGRHVWLMLGGTYTHRTSDLAEDRFNRWEATAGLRLGY